MDANVNVGTHKAKGRFTFEIADNRQTTTPQFVKPPGSDWRVAITGY